MLGGCVTLIVGAVVTLASIETGAPAVLFVGTAAAGLDFGSAFVGHTAPQSRGLLPTTGRGVITAILDRQLSRNRHSGRERCIAPITHWVAQDGARLLGGRGGVVAAAVSLLVRQIASGRVPRTHGAPLALVNLGFMADRSHGPDLTAVPGSQRSRADNIGLCKHATRAPISWPHQRSRPQPVIGGSASPVRRAGAVPPAGKRARHVGQRRSSHVPRFWRRGATARSAGSPLIGELMLHVACPQQAAPDARVQRDHG